MQIFSSPLLKWYKSQQRDLPWRQDKDPYKIWLSEIILQQTRVNQGLPYFLRFVDRFPTVEALSRAEIDEILKLWQGLGYYSRAHNLHRCAKTVVDEFQGEFPRTKQELLRLPGVGDYTASAIASIAFNEKVTVLDGNVFRVLSRYFGIEEFIDTPSGRETFRSVADEMLGDFDPGEFNQALMEFGAMQCTPKSPDCSSCPVSAGCFAKVNTRIESLPRKRGKTNVKPLHLYYYCIVSQGKMAMIQRGNDSIWKGLFEMPNQALENEAIRPWEDVDDWLTLIQNGLSFKNLGSLQHLLSHRKISANFFLIETIDQSKLNNEEVIWVDSKELSELAIPRLIDKFFKTPEGLAVLKTLDC